MIDNKIFEKLESNIDKDEFLTIKSDENGNSAVYYFGRKIADSLKEFLINMNLNTNYYIKK